MPKSRQPKAKASGELLPPSNVCDRIDYWLTGMLTTFQAKGELTEREIADWHRDLSRYPITAIDWAFDTHRRIGNFFPVPSDILKPLETWESPVVDREYTPGCSAECHARHGEGYNGNDMRKLFDMYVAVRKKQDNPLSKRQIFGLLDELDKMRGKSPEWRQNA